MARLYAGWRAGNAEQRQAIVERPWLYLEVDEKQAQSTAPADAGTEREQHLLRDLGALVAICRRVREALRQREADLPWPTVLRYAWQEAQAGFAAVLAVVVEGGPFDVAQDRHA
jgi:acyl-CoA reductase-like NAD-dependent aldehyde dehydrogenase